MTVDYWTIIGAIAGVMGIIIALLKWRMVIKKPPQKQSQSQGIGRTKQNQEQRGGGTQTQNQHIEE